MGSATITAPAVPTLTNVVVAGGAVTGGASSATAITDTAATGLVPLVAALFNLNTGAINLTLTASAVALSGVTVASGETLTSPAGTAAGVASGSLTVTGGGTITTSGTLTFNSGATLTAGGTVTTSGAGKVVVNDETQLRTLGALTTTALAVELGTNITTSAALAIAANVTVTVPNGKTLTIPSGQTVSAAGTGTVTTSGAGKVVVNQNTQLVAVAALTTTALAVELGTDSTMAAALAIGANVTVTVPNGKTLTIPSGQTVSATGTGALTTSGSGKVVVNDGTALVAVAALTTPSLAVELGTTISTNLAIAANVTVTVPNGIVLTIPSTFSAAGTGTVTTSGSGKMEVSTEAALLNAAGLTTTALAVDFAGPTGATCTVNSTLVINSGVAVTVTGTNRLTLNGTPLISGSGTIATNTDNIIETLSPALDFITTAAPVTGANFAIAVPVLVKDIGTVRGVPSASIIMTGGAVSTGLRVTPGTTFTLDSVPNPIAYANCSPAYAGPTVPVPADFQLSVSSTGYVCITDSAWTAGTTIGDVELTFSRQVKINHLNVERKVSWGTDPTPIIHVETKRD
jgi:hypothetical protein